MAHSKMRGFFIKRNVRIVTVDEKTGKTTETLKSQWFPCRVNSSVPFEHKMLK